MPFLLNVITNLLCLSLHDSTRPIGLRNMTSKYDMINPTNGYTSTNCITQQMGMLLIHTKLPNKWVY